MGNTCVLRQLSLRHTPTQYDRNQVTGWWAVKLAIILVSTDFFKLNRFSIWSLYLLVFFIYHTLKRSIELWYYLCKKSVCQMVLEISGIKVACAFLRPKINIQSERVWEDLMVRLLGYNSSGQWIFRQNSTYCLH